MKYLITTVSVMDFQGFVRQVKVYWDDNPGYLRTYVGTQEVYVSDPRVAPVPAPPNDYFIVVNGDTLTFEDVEDSPYVQLLEVTSPVPDLDGFATSTPEDNTEGNGTITISAEGGVAPYKYSKDNITYGNSNVFTGYSAGSYNVYIKDAQGTVLNVPVTVLNRAKYYSTVTVRKYCPTNYTGESVATVDETSYVSQDDAYQKALTGATAEAESLLVCTVNLQFEEVVDPQENLGFTISYSPPLNSWSSFHTYSPEFIFTKGNRVFMGSNRKLYELGTGDFGTYFDKLTEPMTMEFVVNPAVDVTKSFDTLMFHVSSQKEGRENPWDMFDKMQLSTKVQNSGLVNLIVPTSFSEEHVKLLVDQVFAKRKSNEFRVAVPSDLVKDPAISIFDPANLHEDRVFRPRIGGKHMVVYLAYDNEDNNEFQLHVLKTEYRVKAG